MGEPDQPDQRHTDVNTALISGSVTTNNIASSSDLTRLEFAESNFDGPVTFDEPRIATTLADIVAPTPVPEPGVLAMILVAAMFGRGRRKGSRITGGH